MKVQSIWARLTYGHKNLKYDIPFHTISLTSLLYQDRKRFHIATKLNRSKQLLKHISMQNQAKNATEHSSKKMKGAFFFLSSSADAIDKDRRRSIQVKRIDRYPPACYIWNFSDPKLMGHCALQLVKRWICYMEVYASQVGQTKQQIMEWNSTTWQNLWAVIRIASFCGKLLLPKFFCNIFNFETTPYLERSALLTLTRPRRNWHHCWLGRPHFSRPIRFRIATII